MKKQLILEKGVHVIRLALVIDGVPYYFHLEDETLKSEQGQIVQGQITKVMKNLQSAFVDYGKEKQGLLPLKHVPSMYQQRVQQGLRLPIQIVREQTGEKGNKLTSMISLAGKYSVCLPFEPGICLSKKITDPLLRETLKMSIQNAIPYNYGFIIRTDALEVSQEVLLEEICALSEEATLLLRQSRSVSKGTLLAPARPLWFQLFLDHMRIEDTIEIITNDELILKDAQKRLKFYPSFEVKYVLYDKTENLFSIYQIEKTFLQCFKRRIWLKNGSNIVIEKTEALTVIDVNSAKVVDKKNSKEGLLQVNQLAIVEAVYQLMRRNISGMVIIDLIDLKKEADIAKLNDFIAQLILRIEPTRLTAYPITPLGLLQLVRTKKHLPLNAYCLKKETEEDITKAQYRYALLRLEEDLKRLARTTQQEKVYVACEEGFYYFLKPLTFDEKFQATYNLKIDLKLSQKTDGKFYLVYSHD